VAQKGGGQRNETIVQTSECGRKAARHWQSFCKLKWEEMIRTYLKIAFSRYSISMSFRLVRNLSLFSEGRSDSARRLATRFPTRFACGNDSLEPQADFEIMNQQKNKGATYEI
jgi:hypothetical protein